MHVGEIIKKLRKEKRMTLAELSEKSSVALATLSRIENGKMTGTLDSHMRIANILEVSLPDLYKNLAYSKKQVEVKTRKSLITPPQSILSRAQVGRLRVALKSYCLLNKLSYKSSRLDLIVITPKSKQSVCLKHYQDV